MMWDERIMDLESLENLCLDKVASMTHILGPQLQDFLPIALLKCLLQRYNDYQLAVAHRVALARGIDLQTTWQDMCRDEFSWFYRHKFRPNLHDVHWLCCVCQKTTSCGLPSEDVDWFQTYLDKKCEGNLEHMHTSNPGQMSYRNKTVGTFIHEETKKILENPVAPETQNVHPYYQPRQLHLNIKTVIALTKSPWAMGRLAQSLETLMCRVQVPTEYCDLAQMSLEKFLKQSLLEGPLKTLYLKEQQVMRGEAMDYSSLFALLLLGKPCPDKSELVGASSNEKPSTSNSSGGDGKDDGKDSRDQEMDVTSSPSVMPHHAAGDADPGTSAADIDDNHDDPGNDLYDFCFKLPVKFEFANVSNCEDDEDVVICDSGLSTSDLYCEEGAASEEAMSGCTCSSSMDLMESQWSQWRDDCCHFVDPDATYFNHIPRAPNPDVNLGRAISNLVLVYVRLSLASCTALSNGIAQATNLHSLALIQCTTPQCGWCEIFSGLAAGAKGGLLLKELALTFPVPSFRTQPKSLFGQYCAHKLSEFLETYHSKGHKMTSLKLELMLNSKCQAAENSFLPKYVSSIGHLSLSCFGLPFPIITTNRPFKPLGQLVHLKDLATGLSDHGSVLTDLLLDNSLLTKDEVDIVLAAAANAPRLKRVSVASNVYNTSQPEGLVALLEHTGLVSLNICKCRFSLKFCEARYQERIVKALINNCSLQHLNLSDSSLDDEDLNILVKGFADTHRRLQDPGYCLNICLSRFSRTALQNFGERLTRGNSGRTPHQSDVRQHSLDHVAIDWRCVAMIRTLRAIIPKVTCPHRLS